MTNATTAHVIVRGRVQGVGYRAWIYAEARRRGLRGFVRNRRDGWVEALFAGDEAAVADMIEACRIGPRLAAVEDIRRLDGENPPGIPDGFEVWATA
ncbi:MAG TPA: acylphosphatase [Methylomirabilota bacterium]|nr:acylphosphatase [Methylomirabilota bacterium]